MEAHELPSGPKPEVSGKSQLIRRGAEIARFLAVGADHQMIGSGLGINQIELDQAFYAFLRYVTDRHRELRRVENQRERVPNIRKFSGTPIDRRVGPRLRSLRLRKNLSQNDLAGGMQYQGVVSAIELCRRPLTSEWAEKFAPKLGVPAKELINGGPAVEEILHLPEPSRSRVRRVVSLKPLRWVEVRNSPTASGFTPLQLKTSVLLSRGWALREIAAYLGMKRSGGLTRSYSDLRGRLGLHFNSERDFGEWAATILKKGDNRFSEDLRDVSAQLRDAVKPELPVKPPKLPKLRQTRREVRPEPKPVPPVTRPASVFVVKRKPVLRTLRGSLPDLSAVVRGFPLANYTLSEGSWPAWISRYAEVRRTSIEEVAGLLQLSSNEESDRQLLELVRWIGLAPGAMRENLSPERWMSNYATWRQQLEIKHNRIVLSSSKHVGAG